VLGRVEGRSTTSPGKRRLDHYLAGPRAQPDFPHAQSIYAGIARCVRPRAARGVERGGRVPHPSRRRDRGVRREPVRRKERAIALSRIQSGQQAHWRCCAGCARADVPCRRVALRAPAVVNRSSTPPTASWRPGSRGPEGEGVRMCCSGAGRLGTLRLSRQAPFSWPRSQRVPAVDHRPGEPPLFLTATDSPTRTTATFSRCPDPTNPRPPHPGEIGVDTSRG